MACVKAFLLTALVGCVGARFLKPGDHLVHEAVKNANHDDEPVPEERLDADFIALDRNGDKALDSEELTFRQYASGCDPMEAQIRAQDYMACGDANSDGQISLEEFKKSADPKWAECVRSSRDRRAHTFYRFFEADADYDGKLTETELRTEVLRMWGVAGNSIVKPLMTCTDSNKDSHIDQSEFHKSLAAYNPATGSWQLLYHDGDQAVLTCLDAAMKEFDAELAFAATDANKDRKISKGEAFDAFGFNPAINHKAADKLFMDSDVNKDGFLDYDEFKAAGANHKPAAAAMFFINKANTTAPSFDAVNARRWGGMGAVCAARDIQSYSLWSEEAKKKSK